MDHRNLSQCRQLQPGPPAPAVEGALKFGRDLNRQLADRFVGMYVNHWAVDYGEKGREALSLLLREGARAKLVPDCEAVEYVMAR